MKSIEAKNILGAFETQKDCYEISFNAAENELFSEAIIFLCTEEDFMLTGLLRRSERYYVVYKPDPSRIKTISNQHRRHLEMLCQKYNGNIFDVSKGIRHRIDSLDISDYELNKNNCKQLLDDILIKNYKEKSLGRTDELLICKFRDGKILYYSVI